MSITTKYDLGNKCFVLCSNCVQEAQIVGVNVWIQANWNHNPVNYEEHKYKVMFEDGECETVPERHIGLTKEELFSKL